MTRTTYEHIVLNRANLPVIQGTDTSVIELLLDNPHHAIATIDEELDRAVARYRAALPDADTNADTPAAVPAASRKMFLYDQ